MAGVLSGLEALQALIKEGGPKASAKIRELGTMYKQLLKDHPEALAFGKDPAASMKDISKKYNVTQTNLSDVDFEHPLWRFQNKHGGINVAFEKGKSLEDKANEAGYYGLGLAFKPGADYGVIHAIENTQGTGAGNLYPAAFDLMSKLGIRNATDTYVTPINAWRKPLANTIGSMIRADKNLVIPHPKSLEHTRGTPVGYLQNDFDSQIGENFVNGVLGMHGDLVSDTGAANLAAIRASKHAAPSDLANYYGTTPEAVDAIGHFQPAYMDYAGLTGSSNPEDFSKLASQLNAAGVQSVGSASLRKAALLDSFMQGKDFNPKLLQGLEKKCGGLAQIRGKQSKK